MGCGRVGSTLAKSLEKRGHTVAMIDIDVDAFRRLGPDFRGDTVKGVGFDREVLRQAGIEHAGGFAAVSSGDNSNVLAARTVREEFGVDNVVARIYDQGRAEVYERLGIPTVATVRWAANQVLRSLLPEGSEPVWRDPAGGVRLVQMHHHEDWVGKRVWQIQEAVRTPLPIVMRFGKGMIPAEDTVLQDGDLLYVAVASDRLDEVESALANPPVKH
ncbi:MULTISPECIES: potassium channel family protein [Aestuariimicrobium]|uniref:potassium channel family protein n=1 Tax=Aestuariimicrobium TaxID=396388 RepID=UPI001B7FA458|nr:MULTISPECIES: TrkA family potassium uptake protein [Aestuariimicrobium]CAI9408769.1 Trk system potassium uptake protein TrkA [Aestuariimicrobium sp. T2.26MG-19.2B]